MDADKYGQKMKKSIMFFSAFLIGLISILNPDSASASAFKSTDFSVEILAPVLYKKLIKSNTLLLASGPFNQPTAKTYAFSAGLMLVSVLEIDPYTVVVDALPNRRLISINFQSAIKISKTDSTGLKIVSSFVPRVLDFSKDFHELKYENESKTIYLLNYRLRGCNDGIYTLDICNWLKLSPIDTFADCEILNVDLKGNVIKKWSLADVVDEVEFRYAVTNAARLGSGTSDPFHCNSIDIKQNKILVSARHTNSLYEIDALTGRVNWKFGGAFWPGKSLEAKNSNFIFREISGQHDAQYLGRNQVLFFDNATNMNAPARGVLFSIMGQRYTNPKTFVNPDGLESGCTGSFRAIDGGRYFVAGWGCTESIATVFGQSGIAIASLRSGLERGNFGPDIYPPFSYRVTEYSTLR